MAYSQTWDETFPPDTQAANLLGDDIRDFKTAVRERVQSFGAGTLGSRPTPEAVWTGVMYFATDTGQIFRWTGASWTDITASIITSGKVYKDALTKILSGTGITTAYSVNIPAGILGVLSKLRITIPLGSGSGVSGDVVRLKFGGVTALTIAVNFVNSNGGIIEIFGGNNNSLSLQNWLYNSMINGDSSVMHRTAVGSGSVNTTAGVTVSLEVELNNPASSIIINGFFIEII